MTTTGPNTSIQVTCVLDPELLDNDETLYRIPPQPHTRTDQTLCSSDALYLQFYWLRSGMWFDLINDGMTGVSDPLGACVARRFGLHISSKLVRSAFLFYSSYRKDGKISCLGMQYLAQFYEGAREAICQESYTELVYACYAICLYEMGSKRMFSDEFTKHAKGFLISYQNLVKSCALTTEENKVLGAAYEVIMQATQLSSPNWHQEENWFLFGQTVIQRLNSAESRLLNSTKTISTCNIPSVWIPLSHHLLTAEHYVYQICSLFNLLADKRDFEWIDTAAAIRNRLNALWETISQPAIFDSQQKSATVLVLKDGITTLASDKFCRQLLTLYYIFLLQYLILVQEWSESTWFEVIETSGAICRLFPSPHESTYPGSEIRFIVNRGLFCAGVVLVQSHHNGGNFSSVLIN
jgi:hypothetical protein